MKCPHCGNEMKENLKSSDWRFSTKRFYFCKKCRVKIPKTERRKDETS